MLFEKLLDGITAIIEFFAKVILFLLKVLGLWIPTIYSIAFVILCAIFKVSFNSVLAIYLVGLALSVIFAFYVMFLKVMHRKKRRFMKRQERKVKSKARKNAIIENKKKKEEDAVSEDKMIIRPPVDHNPKPEQQPVMEQFKPDKYQPYQSPETYVPENIDRTMQSYPPLQFNPEPPLYVPKPEPTITYSKPKIFRTRMDPNLLIYEYSDRLVFYRKTLNGLEHVKTERKDPSDTF